MSDSVQKRIINIGHGFMLLLVFLSLYFCNERMMHTDNAYCTFLLLNNEEFVFSHYRYPLVITQILPLIAIKLNASVQSVIAAYSVNFYAVYYGCFLLCLFVFKNIKAAIIIVLGLLVAHKEIFFLQTEICHGLVLACLFYAWYTFKPNQTHGIIKKAGYYLFGAIIFAATVTIHPLAALFLIILMGWNVLESKNYSSVFNYVLILIVIVAVVLKAKLTPADSYEGSFYKQTETLKETLLHLPSSYTLRFFVGRLVEVYFIPFLMFAMGLVWLVIKKKQYLLALYVSVATIGYLILAAVIFKGDSDIMMERIFLVFGFIASLMFAHMMLSILEQGASRFYQNGLSLLMAGCLMGGVLFILKGARRYEERLEIVSKQAASLQQQAGTKFYSTNDRFKYPFSFWSNTCEQLLFSAVHYPTQLKTLYIFNDQTDVESVLGNNTDERVFLLVPFYLKLDQDYLNKKYFNLSQGAYVPAKL